MGFLYSVDLPDQEGSRLDDLSVTPVGYGDVIPVVNGTRRVSGKLFFQAPIVETVHEEEVEAGGKGGSSSYKNTTYTYSATFAMMLSSHKVQGIKRIWLNSKLFYENQPFMSGDILKARQDAEAIFDFYTGDESQTVNPVMEVYNKGKTPAYRGRAYIVFYNLELEEFGNRIPLVEVELVENGTGVTENGAVIPYPNYLWNIVGDICLRSGLPKDLFDVTELTDEIYGYSVESDRTGLEQLKELAEAYHFYPTQEGEKLIFRKEPTPVARDEHLETCLINEDGLLVNAYHTTLGRQGYFPSEAGTSEGQFLIIRAACLAYQQTSDANWLGLIEKTAGAIDILYNQPPPSDPNTLYIPHWLFNVKAPISLQTNKLNVKGQNTYYGSGDDTTYYTFIPAGHPYYGEKVKYVTGVYSDVDSFVSWFNPYASIIGTEFDLISYTTDETGTWVNYDHNLSGGQPDKPNIKVVYDFGEKLGVSQLMEAWAHWRKLDEGEIDCAVDTLPWALECFELLHQVTGDSKYQDAYNATVNSTIKTFDVDDGRDWIRPTSGSPYAQSGTYLFSARAGFSYSSVLRNRDLTLRFDIPSGEGEVQFGRGITGEVKTSDTHIRLNFVASAPQGLAAIWFFLQSGETLQSSTVRYIKKYIINPTSFVGGATDIELDLSEFVRHSYDTVTGEFYVPDGSTATLASDTASSNVDINVVGFIVPSQMTGSITLDEPVEVTLRSMRPLPVVQLPYTPYVAPYTANAVSGSLIDWRGSAGVGYQDPVFWATLNDSTALSGMLDFIEDSEQEYGNRYNGGSPTGLFVPAYIWDRFDAQEVADVYANTWTFNWVDPNSEWVGYTARVIAACGKAGDIAANTNGDAANANRAFAIAGRFCTWLNSVWTDHNKFIPTNFPSTISTLLQRSKAYETDSLHSGNNGFMYKAVVGGVSASTLPTLPTTLHDTVVDGTITWECAGYTYGTFPVYGVYDEPHAASLFMRSAAYLYLNGINTSDTLAIVQRCWNYLERLWANTSGDVVGTWSHNPDGEEWFGFWSGEIVTTLSLLLGDLSSVRVAAGISSTTINERLAEHALWIISKTRTLSYENLEDLITENDYRETRVKETDLPRKVEIGYNSKLRDNSEDLRYAEKRSGRSSETETYNLPVTITGDEALSIARRTLNAIWSKRTQYEFELIGRLYQSGDVKEFNVNGTPRIMQFTEIELHPDGYQIIKANSYDDSSFTGVALSSGDPQSTTGVTTLAGATVVIMESTNSINLYKDSQDSVGFMAYAIPNGSNWRGAKLMMGVEDNNYTSVADIIKEPTHGTVNTLIPTDKKRTLIDTTTTINVSLRNGTLSSVTESEWLSGVNKGMFGREFIHFKDVVLQEDGTYNISNLIRYVDGTFIDPYYEASTTHNIGEQFLLLSGEGVVDVKLTQAELFARRFFKLVSVGQTEADVTPIEISKILSARIKPLPPTHLKAERLSGGLRISWQRQTRLSAEWLDNRDAPLDASYERYAIEVFKVVGGSDSRLLTIYVDDATTHEIAYSSIDATFDDEVFIRVRQVSEFYGFSSDFHNYEEATAWLPQS